jgi:DNA repair exonuclease SbcCD ATPase subunit
MAKVTALKKSSGESKNLETVKNCRIPNVEVPSTIIQAVQAYIKDKGITMAQFWKEAATYRLQVEELKEAREELDRILGQIASAEEKLREIEFKEELIAEKEARLNELEQEQNAIFEDRKKELDQMAVALEEEYQARLAELAEAGARQEEEHKARLAAIENEVRERTEEYRRYLELDFQNKEREIIKREAQIEVRDEITAEKEKFWSTMYDAVVKLTRVCGSLK